jgi:transposase
MKNNDILEFGLMEIELKNTKRILASLEKALEDRDKQIEKMYSEEEVYTILVQHTIELFKKEPCTLDEWFEKHKKK